MRRCILVLLFGLALASLAQAEEQPELLRALKGRHPEAAGIDRAVLLQRILKRDPKALEASGSRALPMAILYHDAQSVRVLLDHGADPNGRHGRQSVLNLTIGERQSDIVDLLLSAGAKVNQSDLVLASHLGLTKCIEMLLGKGAKVDAPDDSGTWPIQAAAEGNRLAALGFLLARGARVRVSDRRPRRPLQLAARWGHVDVARVLIEHGAPVESKHRAGLRPVELAILGGHRAMVDLLLQRGAHETVFVQVAVGNPYYLAREKDVPGARLEGETLLHAAVRFGHPEVVRALLDAKVDPRVATPYAGTPLHLAARRGDLASARLLVDAGADVKVPNAHGITALHFAAAGGHGLGRAIPEDPLLRNDGYRRLTKLLIERGADVDAPQSKSLYVGKCWRPLHHALGAGRVDIAAVLLRAGAKTSWPEKQLQALTPGQERVLAAAREAAGR